MNSAQIGEIKTVKTGGVAKPPKKTRLASMSFSEEDIEALGTQLNLMNSFLQTMDDNLRMIKNILVSLSVVIAIGSFAILLSLI